MYPATNGLDEPVQVSSTMPPVALLCTVTGVPGAARVVAENESPEFCVVRLNAARVPPVTLPIRMPRASRSPPAAASPARRFTPRSAAGARSVGAR